MRKIILLEMITIDGVLQAPGSPEEDTSGGFAYGGWTAPYVDDFGGKILAKQMSSSFDLLLGKKTYDIWAAYWPKQSGAIAEAFNKKAHKYVASHNRFDPTWQTTTIFTEDVAIEINRLKAEDGPDLQVYGSGNFVQTLLRNELVDEMWLKIFPVTLGVGKRLFAEGTIPRAFKLIDSSVSPSGVIFANYKRAGEVETGSVT
jgi:dihydrofolate reductase